MPQNIKQTTKIDKVRQTISTIFYQGKDRVLQPVKSVVCLHLNVFLAPDKETIIRKEKALKSQILKGKQHKKMPLRFATERHRSTNVKIGLMNRQLILHQF